MALDRETVAASVDAIEAQIKKHKMEIEKLERAKRALQRLSSNDLHIEAEQKKNRLGHGVPQRLVSEVLSKNKAMSARDIVEAVQGEYGITLHDSTLRGALSKLERSRMVVKNNGEWSIREKEENDDQPF